jgi:hypothetical protein
MKTHTARLVLKEMKACLAEIDLQIVNEMEKLDQKVLTDHLMCRSYLARGAILAEILGIVVPSHDVVQLSMNFWHDTIELTRAELLEVLSFVNNSSYDSYWVLFETEKKIEYRTAFSIPAGNINRKHFLRVLKTFIETGYQHYIAILGMLENHEMAAFFLREAKTPLYEEY